MAGDSKRTHRRGLVQVGHQNRVLARGHDDVAVSDRLDVHEGDNCVVLVDKGGRRIASQDLAKHALVSHRAVRSLKRRVGLRGRLQVNRRAWRGLHVGVRHWYRRLRSAIGPDLVVLFDVGGREVRMLLCMSLAVGGALWNWVLATTPAPCAALATMWPRKTLNLRPDPDSLARGDHRADSGHQALLLRVLEERSEELGGAADHRFGIADDDE